MNGKQTERHHINQIGWIRATVLGANDGIVSTASLMVGVAAANVGRSDVILAGIAGLAAGALSMAAGEFVSVSSQSDIEKADLKRERRELAQDIEREKAELAQIYMSRGLDRDLAVRVSEQLMAFDALGAHARDELGISEHVTARPLQAALASAGSFSVGAILPLLAMLLAPLHYLMPAVITTSLIALALLGWAAANTGGARVGVSVLRVTFWGAVAMALTAGIGAIFGTVV